MSAKTTSKVITCKAVVCWGAEGPVKLEEIQVDPPKSSEVRLQMLYASVCHTDILCIKGIPIPLYPRVIGHEGVGVVESVGEEVSDLKEGDVVIPTYIGECQKCENCTSGRSNLCHSHPLSFNGVMVDGTSRFSIGGQKLYHLLSCSTWSQYTVINSNYVLKVHGNLGLSHASFISCGFSTGFGAAWKEAQIEKGSSVAVFGLGAVGLGAVEGARLQGATKIIGVDKNERKREKGEAFGMTDFINPSDSEKSISELVKEMTGGVGVDYCIECTGAAPLLNEGLESTKAGKGKMIMIGLGNEATAPLSFMSLLIGRTLKGSIFGGIKVKSDLPFIIEKCINKEIQLDELLTHEIALEDIGQAFELLKRQDCVKVLIKI